MKNTLTSKFAILIGIFLLVEGIWGSFSPVVFGALTTNMAHAVIHMVLGITGIYLGMNNKARKYCLFLGTLLLVVGILRFIPGTDNLLVQLLNINYPVAYVNIFIGLASLLIVLTEKTVGPKNVERKSIRP